MENIIKELIRYENMNKSIRQEMEVLKQKIELLERSVLTNPNSNRGVNETELYTVKETSKILKVGIHKVYDLIDNGLLVPLKLGSLKIPAKQIDKFILDYTGKDLTDLNNIKSLN